MNIVAETSPRVLEEHLGRALGVGVVTKHVGILVPPTVTIDAPPRIHISSPAKPWREA